MAHNSTNQYLQLLDELKAYDVPKIVLDSLLGYVKSIYESEIGNRFSSPMLSIGLYIVLASLIFTFAMGADLVDGFRSKKLWFACKYFRINSFYLAVISVAMKLPVDLTGLMPGHVDQVAKMGSVAFMCTIMANLLPCLGTMDHNHLYSNITALGVLVITMVVNVCIQVKTGVVSTSTYNKNKDPRIAALVSPEHNITSLPKIYTMLPIIYVTLLLVLLVIYVCSCFGVLAIKRYIEGTYRTRADDHLREILQTSEGHLTVTKLEEYVTNHWIMALTGNYQFIFTAFFPTTCASGVICVFVAILHILTIIWSFKAMLAKDYGSDYSWSTMSIVSLQLIGVVIGTIAPLCRCFAPNISFDCVPRRYYGSVYEPDEFLTSVLYHWRRAVTTGLPSKKLEVIIQTLKRVIANFCIGFLVVVLVVCQVIALGPNSFWISVKWLLNAVHDGERTGILEEARYNLSRGLSHKLTISTRTMEGLLESVKQLIQKGENKKPLQIDLLQRSTSDFYGLRLSGGIDSSNEKYWSLKVITLATIACSLPEIEKKQADWLLTNVRECLPYVILVDKTFNVTFHDVQKDVKVLWEEVDVYHQWLGKKLPLSGDPSFQLNTARQVVEWFEHTARSKTSPIRHRNIIEVIEGLNRRLFTNAMQSTCLEISSSHRWEGDDILASQGKLFDSLSLFIADIMVACLTNLPQVILNKCHPRVLGEQIEANVKDAALLFGETKQIIEILGQLKIPVLDSSDMPFYYKWHACIWPPSA